VAAAAGGGAGRCGLGRPPLAPRRALAPDIAAAAAAAAPGVAAGGASGAGGCRPACSGTTSTSSGRAWLPFRSKGDPAILLLQQELQQQLLEQQQMSAEGGEPRLSERLASRGQVAPRDILPPPINLKPKKRIGSWSAAGFAEAVAKGLADLGLTWVPDAYDSTGYVLRPVQQQQGRGARATRAAGGGCSSTRATTRTGRKQQQAQRLATVVEEGDLDTTHQQQQQQKQPCSCAATAAGRTDTPPVPVGVCREGGGAQEAPSSSCPWRHMVPPPDSTGCVVSLPAAVEAGQGWGPVAGHQSRRALLLQPAAVLSTEPSVQGGSRQQQQQQQQQGPLPPSVEGPTAQLVVLVLLHEAGWPTAAVWEKWERLHGGTAAVVCHYKQGAPLTGNVPGLAQIQARMCGTRVSSRWGDISLTGESLALNAPPTLTCRGHGFQGQALPQQLTDAVQCCVCFCPVCCCDVVVLGALCCP
jgi:hypothetical protein